MLQTYSQRVEIQSSSDVVHFAFIGQANMRRADAAIGARGGKIGVNRVGCVITVRNVVGAAGDQAGVFGIGRTGESVGAHVVIDFGLARDQAAVVLESGFDPYHRAETPAGEKYFIPSKDPLHGPPRLVREQRDHGLDARSIFAAIATAHRRYDHAHAIERQLEYFGELLLQRRGCLAGRVNQELSARIPESRDRVGLDVAMLDWRKSVNVFNDFVGFAQPWFDIPAGGAIDAVNIAAGLLIDMLFVNNRGTRTGCFKDAGHGGQFFVVDLD